ncbi:MAG: transporter [Brevundimonas sp.]|uniref:transporter n=1 Tax=Brevundimonas sp. TaxID=1871086 RepID=UPI00248985B2|nr:transporter [Brevundimonas sp.]MDI1326083.1 transporter [Brevundimonas sp.]
MSKFCLFGAACVAALAVPGLASAQVVWEGTAGVDYSSGKYGGSQDTHVLYAPLGLRAQANRWRVELAVPYVNIRGPEGSVGGGVVVPGDGAVSSRSGLGDVTLSAAYQLMPAGGQGLSLEVGGTVKFPTADEDLGTGESDYNLLVSAQLPLADRFRLTGSVGYSWLGDPDLYELEDGVTASLGAIYDVSATSSLGLMGSYRAEYFAGLGEQTQLNPFVSFRSASGWSATAYGTVGLSDAAPDYGAGLQLGRTF